MFWPIIKTRRLKPREGNGEIDKTLARREIKQSQRAGDGETASPGNRHATLIVPQQEVGFRRLRQRDRVTFAGVEHREVVRV